METIRNSVWKEEFDSQDSTRMDQKFYLEATSTCPFIAYKFNTNFTVYNVDAAIANYFDHYNDQIFTWVNDCFCKPVEDSFVLLCHDHHFWCIQTRGTKLPTIVHRNLILCKKSHKASFRIEK